MRKKLLILVFVVLAGCYFLSYFAYSVPVLMYHSIDFNADKSQLSVTPESFDKQMKFLKQRGFNIMTFAEYSLMLEEGSRPRSRSVVITFDDGFENNYMNAYPVLKKYNIPAIIFVVTDWVGEKDMMSWTQIKELSQDSLIEIGSHTLNHDELTKMSRDEAIHQINASKKMLQKKLKKDIKFFSYPCGSFNPSIRKQVIKAGYTSACATHPGGETQLRDPYAIRRIRISRSADNMFVFWGQVSGYYSYFKDRKVKKRNHEENSCY